MHDEAVSTWILKKETKKATGAAYKHYVYISSNKFTRDYSLCILSDDELIIKLWSKPNVKTLVTKVPCLDQDLKVANHQELAYHHLLYIIELLPTMFISSLILQVNGHITLIRCLFSNVARFTEH